MPEAINFASVEAAAKRLEGNAVYTPLLENPFINEIAGRRVVVKAECLQRTGSFKFRGAWSAISAIDNEIRKQGVLAFSSGNHAQGIALAAQIAGIPAVVVMPNDAPALKIENTKKLGAEVILYDRPGGEDREKIGIELAEQRGLTLIKPYDNANVMAGQGTCGLEIAEQAVALGISQADVLVCCGGGGLTSGIAMTLETAAPDLRVRPVEPQNYDDVMRSLQTGERQFIDNPPHSICDAIVTPAPGELTFPILNRLCKPGIAVTDEEALAAMGHALRRLKIVAEPGGSVALAAALYHTEKITGDAVICVVSGGNADDEMISRALQASLSHQA